MVGCGSLSDCGEECEIQLSASSSDLMCICSPSGSILLWQTPYCSALTVWLVEFTRHSQISGKRNPEHWWKLIFLSGKAWLRIWIVFCHKLPQLSSCYLSLHGRESVLLTCEDTLSAGFISHRSRAFVSLWCVCQKERRRKCKRPSDSQEDSRVYL